MLLLLGSLPLAALSPQLLLYKHSPGVDGGSLLSIHAGDPGQRQSTKPREVSPGAEEPGVSPCLSLPASSAVG